MITSPRQGPLVVSSPQGGAFNSEKLKLNLNNNTNENLLDGGGDGDSVGKEFDIYDNDYEDYPWIVILLLKSLCIAKKQTVNVYNLIDLLRVLVGSSRLCPVI